MTTEKTLDTGEITGLAQTLGVPAVSDVDEEAHQLLGPNEPCVPSAVLHTSRFLTERGVWFQLARNHAAYSCRDAVHKRWRLGYQGIDLWDELKSFLGRFVNAAGREQYVVAHCRADRRLDFSRLQEAVHSRMLPERLGEEELERIGLAYGLINPFDTWRAFTIDGPLFTTPILHIFDRELLQPVGLPGTMMTNAGDLTWAVEFDVHALIRNLDHGLVADIAEPDPEQPGRPQYVEEAGPIGILTGNAPESGMALWQRINNHTRSLLGTRCLGDVSMPPVLVNSLPALGLTMELEQRHEAVWRHLRIAVTDLCRQGIRFLAIACHTTHYFSPKIREICQEYGVEFVSIAEVLAAWLRATGVKRVALVGIGFVADLGPWSAYREVLADFETEELSARAKQRLHELAYQVKQEGVSEAGLNHLRDVLRQEVMSGYVVLALTELSLLLAKQRRKSRSGKVLIDPLDVYGEALARHYLGLPIPGTCMETSS